MCTSCRVHEGSDTDGGGGTGGGAGGGSAAAGGGTDDQDDSDTKTITNITTSKDIMT